MNLSGIDVGCPDGCVALVLINQISPSSDANAMRIIFLWSIINDRVGIPKRNLGCKGMHDFAVSHDEHCVWALCTCFVASLHPAPCHQNLSQKQFARSRLSQDRALTFVTGNCPPRNGVDHGVGIMHEVYWHFGVLHERPRCVDGIERCLLLECK